MVERDAVRTELCRVRRRRTTGGGAASTGGDRPPSETDPASLLPCDD
jgi:hypothetical protein